VIVGLAGSGRGQIERPGLLAGSPAGSAQRSRRELLRWAALAGGTFAFAELLAACGAGTGGATGGPAGTTSDGTLRGLVAGVPQLSVLAAQGQLPVGRSRFAFGLAGPTNALVERASPQPWFAKAQAASPLGPFSASWADLRAYQATRDRSPRSQLAGYYLAQVRLPSAGTWLGVALVEVASQRAAGQASVLVGGQQPAPVGSTARSGRSPVATSATARAEVCTRQPACPMHAVSLDAALANGRPTVVSFATPLLCAGRLCGPVVDEQLQAFRQLGERANFVHVELYPARRTDRPAPPYLAWGLRGEPWLFVVDRHAAVRARSQGPVAASEATAALPPSWHEHGRPSPGCWSWRGWGAGGGRGAAGQRGVGRAAQPPARVGRLHHPPTVTSRAPTTSRTFTLRVP